MKISVCKSVKVLTMDAIIDGTARRLVALEIEVHDEAGLPQWWPPLAFSPEKGRELAQLILQTCDELQPKGVC